MLLRSLRALRKAPRGAGTIWKYLEALVRATGVSGRLAYGFWTELHFAHVHALPLDHTLNKFVLFMCCPWIAGIVL
jgi:hypothetical protein